MQKIRVGGGELNTWGGGGYLKVFHTGVFRETLLFTKLKKANCPTKKTT